MRYSQAIFVTSALFSGLASRVAGQASNTTYNLIAQMLALKTNSTPVSLFPSNTFNATTFVEEAVLAIGTTLTNLIVNNQTQLNLCNNTYVTDNQTFGPHCDNSPNPGSFLADLIFDFAESLGATEAFMGDPTFSQEIPQLLYNVTELLIQANSTAACVRIVNENEGTPVFTVAIVLVDGKNQAFPTVLADVDEVVFPTNNATDIWNTCFGINYTSYNGDVDTAISKASKMTEESILLQLSIDAELREIVKELLGLSACSVPTGSKSFWPF